MNPADLKRAQDSVAADMRHLAKNLRELSALRRSLQPSDVLVLAWSVQVLQQEAYRVAERCDLLPDGDAA